MYMQPIVTFFSIGSPVRPSRRTIMPSSVRSGYFSSASSFMRSKISVS